MISEEEVKKIAKLSYLTINDEELKKFQNDFSAILDYVNKLKELNVENIEETANLSHSKNIFREDKEILFNSEELIKLMPHSKNNYLEVKKILNND
ncbi:MAG: Asp-tRNA(Asn)/Glu-tRNA(Gln) amidotransferase subunit GatC [Candidatus Paceibacterota bacterium]|jgi:aspartyl-tRNA(Asn)/glutamyl-tRNA(Gln) amidotransferase subunit C